MDKKTLNNLIEGIVNQVASENKLDENEARTFVGVALRRNRDAFLSVVRVPLLQVGPAPAPAAETQEEATETAPELPAAAAV